MDSVHDPVPFLPFWSIDPYNIEKDCGLQQGCDGVGNLETWLNTKEVRNAIHIESGFDVQWNYCVSGPFQVYPRGKSSMAPQIRTMAEHGLKTVLYYGDVDSVCSFVGGKW